MELLVVSRVLDLQPKADQPLRPQADSPLVKVEEQVLLVLVHHLPPPQAGLVEEGLGW